MSYYYSSSYHPYKAPLEPPRRRWGLRRTSTSLKPSHWQARPSISASLWYHTPRSRSYYTPPEPSRQSRHSHRSRLTDLPNELKLNIFETLDRASSACLGLSSRKLYPLHRSVHKNVGLYEQSPDSQVPLAFRLKDWMPKDYALDWQSEKFVKRDRLAGLEAERKRERDKYWDERRRLWAWDDDYDDRERGGRRRRRRRH